MTGIVRNIYRIVHEYAVLHIAVIKSQRILTDLKSRTISFHCTSSTNLVVEEDAIADIGMGRSYSCIASVDASHVQKIGIFQNTCVCTVFYINRTTESIIAVFKSAVGNLAVAGQCCYCPSISIDKIAVHYGE